MKNFNSNYGEHKRSHDNLSRAIGFPLPVQEGSLFKHGATPHILNFLSDNPEINLSIRQLARFTPVSERATREAVDALAANGLVETPQSIISQADRVDTEQLFGRGITLYSTEVLDRIKVEVLSEE